MTVSPIAPAPTAAVAPHVLEDETVGRGRGGGQADALRVEIQGFLEAVLLVDLVAQVPQTLALHSFLGLEIKVLPLETGGETFLQDKFHPVFDPGEMGEDLGDCVDLSLALEFGANPVVKRLESVGATVAAAATASEAHARAPDVGHGDGGRRSAAVVAPSVRVLGHGGDGRGRCGLAAGTRHDGLEATSFAHH